MDPLDIELGAVVDLVKELVAAGQRKAAGVLLKSAMEPLQKNFDERFLVDTADAAKSVAKSRGVPFSTQLTQRGNERSFVFKTGYHAVEHRRIGNQVEVTLRKTIDGPCPFRDLALAKAIQVKLQRVYAQQGNYLLAKTAELMKVGQVKQQNKEKKAKWEAKVAVTEDPGMIAGSAYRHSDSLEEKKSHARARRNVRGGPLKGIPRTNDPLAHKAQAALLGKAKIDEWRTRDIIESKTPKIKRQIRQTRKEAPGDPLAAKGKVVKGDVVQFDPSKRKKPIEAPSAPGKVVGGLLSPEQHLEAMEHHVNHLAHHNLHALKAAKAGGSAELHSALADEHYRHALSHANRINRGKHDVALMQGMIGHTLSREQPITAFKPHPHDAALGNRLVDPEKMTKADAFLQDLAKALRRRAPRRKRALGRKRRTQGVWSEHSKVHGKQSIQQQQTRHQSQVQQQSGGMMGAIASLFGG